MKYKNEMKDEIRDKNEIKWWNKNNNDENNILNSEIF